MQGRRDEQPPPGSARKACQPPPPILGGACAIMCVRGDRLGGRPVAVPGAPVRRVGAVPGTTSTPAGAAAATDHAMKRLPPSLPALAAGLLVIASGMASATAPASGGPHAELAAQLDDDGRGTDWVLDSNDSLCGLSEARQLSSPAKVDYPALLSCTDEYETIRKEKLDPGTARWIELHNAAHSKVVAACSQAMTDGGHCSVWKKIRHRRGNPITDLTATVRASLKGS